MNNLWIMTGNLMCEKAFWKELYLLFKFCLKKISKNAMVVSLSVFERRRLTSAKGWMCSSSHAPKDSQGLFRVSSVQLKPVILPESISQARPSTPRLWCTMALSNITKGSQQAPKQAHCISVGCDEKPPEMFIYKNLPKALLMGF